jgi:hypothetical protein
MYQPHTSHSRRQVLHSLAAGSLLLPGIMSELLAEMSSTIKSPSDPLTPKPPHFPAKAKRVIFLFSTGGVSHMDTFDPKPNLFAADGKKTGVGGGLSREQKVLLKPMWDFKPGGKCGTMVSDLFPNIRDCMDDICLIRSMKGQENEHYQATLAIHTGSFFFSRPSLGSWLSYGLGTLNQNSAGVSPGSPRRPRSESDPEPRPPHSSVQGSGTGARAGRNIESPARSTA